MIARFQAWSEVHPIMGHAIFPGSTHGIAGALYMTLAGASWPWAIGAGTLLSIVGMTHQESSDQRCHNAIQAHHIRLVENAQLSRGLSVDRGPEVWHGWSWEDWVGGVLGGTIFAAAAVGVAALISALT